jgi:hypothetical protein
MPLPGFTAEATLYRTAGYYAGTCEACFATEVIPAALPTGMACMEACIAASLKSYFKPGQTFNSEPLILACAAICGVEPAVALARSFASYIGLGGAAAEAGTGGGFLAAEGFGLTGGAAVAAPIVLFAIAILIAAHDIPAAVAGPTQQPATTPAGCSGGTYDPSENITGWSIPLKYPGCAGAWDHSQANAQEICDAHLTCSGTCPNGQPCKAVAILIDRVDETSYFLTCRAEGKYTCQCGCQ